MESSFYEQVAQVLKDDTKGREKTQEIIEKLQGMIEDSRLAKAPRVGSTFMWRGAKYTVDQDPFFCEGSGCQSCKGMSECDEIVTKSLNTFGYSHCYYIPLSEVEVLHYATEEESKAFHDQPLQKQRRKVEEDLRFLEEEHGKSKHETESLWARVEDARRVLENLNSQQQSINPHIT